MAPSQRSVKGYQFFSLTIQLLSQIFVRLPICIVFVVREIHLICFEEASLKVLCNSQVYFTGLVIFLSASVLGCSQPSSNSKFEISSADVTAISASITNHPDMQQPNIDEFELPAQLHDDLLSMFYDAQPHKSEMDWAELGQLKVTIKDQTYSIKLFSVGDMFIFDVPDGPNWKKGMYEADRINKLIQLITDAKKSRDVEAEPE